MAMRTVLAIDLGADTGRVMAVHFDGQRLTADELHRFQNIPVLAGGTLYWDILRLFGDMQAGIRKAHKPDALGLDTWGVDFAFLDRAGHLLGNPVHYRDRRNDGAMDYVHAIVPRQEIFARTGIQIMQINSLYQMATLIRDQDPTLDNAAAFLMLPDLLYYWLTGVKINEFTDTTTSQCYDPHTGTWAFELLERIGIPTRLFGDIVEPGQVLGKYEGIPAVVAAHHDTASAVVAVPTRTPHFAYISSGTWSLLGLELPHPVINDAVLEANITNEGGYGGTYRFLKNIAGMWLIQESRRQWQREGQEYSYDTLTKMAAEAAPFVSLIHGDDPRFLAPGEMPNRIRQFCKDTGQPVPESVGEVARCIFQSLALKYRIVLRQEMALTQQPVEALHIVGGGSLNTLLCQMTADATGIPVLAGPVEATALGNAIAQLIALGDLKSVEEGRALVRESFPLSVYEPRDTTAWDAVEERFRALM
jgi:sugar (pentulose or hexulose) kinase